MAVLLGDGQERWRDASAALGTASASIETRATKRRLDMGQGSHTAESEGIAQASHHELRAGVGRLRLVSPPVRPRIGGASTSQGRSYGIFQKALQRRNVVAAVAAARELPKLSLGDALELTFLIAHKDPPRHRRAAARWLQRYLEEHPEAKIEEAALVASCLAALPGGSYKEAVQTLRAWPKRPLAGERRTA
jgi:hypothetical protein